MIHALNIVWNPSEGIDLGFYTIHFYSLMFVIAFGLGWFIMKYIFIRENETLEKHLSERGWGMFFFTIGNITAII
jgi:phosphatidylglycerol---prolipoprotein diacylglyceryl transferase